MRGREGGGVDREVGRRVRQGGGEESETGRGIQGRRERVLHTS